MLEHYFTKIDHTKPSVHVLKNSILPNVCHCNPVLQTLT